MSPAEIVALNASPVVVTSIELGYRNQRHPFGDKHFKATFWWIVVVIVDAIVADAVFFGILSVKLVDQTGINAAKGVWFAILLGVLGPLALRSPVKKANISHKESTVGITYIYDLARLNALYALDERFVRLRRRDVMRRQERWEACGINVDDIVKELYDHIDDHERMSNPHREEVRENIRNILTLPDAETQITGLIKLMRSERFKSLIDEFDSRVPP